MQCLQNYMSDSSKTLESPKGAKVYPGGLLLDVGLVNGWGSKDSWLLIVCND